MPSMAISTSSACHQLPPWNGFFVTVCDHPHTAVKEAEPVWTNLATHGMQDLVQLAKFANAGQLEV